MTVNHLDTIEIETGTPVKGSVIWLHGLGADGHDFEPLVPEFKRNGTPLRFIFPHAPVRPITINAGMPMRGWYDILDLNKDAPQDEVGIRDSERLIRALIDREIERGVPSERIVLAGFSQGCAITLQTALRYDKKLAGILALSGYLPLEAQFDNERHQANQETPIFMSHGSFDPVLPVDFGRSSKDKLKDLGYQIKWAEYPMPHSVCPQQVQEVRTWLEERLP